METYLVFQSVYKINMTLFLSSIKWLDVFFNETSQINISLPCFCCDNNIALANQSIMWFCNNVNGKYNYFVILCFFPQDHKPGKNETFIIFLKKGIILQEINYPFAINNC